MRALEIFGPTATYNFQHVFTFIKESEMKLVKQIVVWTFILFFATEVRSQELSCPVILPLGFHAGTIVEAVSADANRYRFRSADGTVSGCFIIDANARAEIPKLAYTAFVLRLPVSVSITSAHGNLASIAVLSR